MIRLLKRLLKEESGNVLILGALSMIGLLGMAGLVIDGGFVYMTKSELQKVANATVLSGAQELTGHEENVDKIVNDILTAHKETATLQNIQITMGEKLAIDLTKPVNLSFMRLFGFQKVDVKAHSQASLGVLGRAIGAAPLGINDNITLEYYKTYQLKVDSTEVQSGNFGILALGGPGARTYEENLRYGYQEELKTGDIIDTQTGNIAGKTQTVIQELVNGCSYFPGDDITRNCSRVILIPVYKPYENDQNQMKSVMVTGFAYFFITAPMSSNDTSITGMFIKRTGTGFYEEGSSDKGAYSIRLTE
ncbi:Tad domain-containing protein [Neobacillus sp. PS3-40]|uniref:Tad domain-containing protein n=1 Tax=Neobacillus sp. PS3-40 TaxID=3070679 RepID=UPI0027E0E9C0|nr:Tad domain-containing protein [Neobacillus sp. PS3-40]WML43332.1 Tad domain-containing protein [Neobacillus sp. PS3-40]